MKRFLIPGILLACVILSIVLPREIGDLSAEETLRLGAGDDISGFFLDYVVSLTKMGEVKELSSYAFQDC